MATTTHRYKKSFSINDVFRIAKAAGETVINKALTLYYCARDTDTPAWASTTIYGALVYLINPVDAIPDILPMGYTDDLAALTFALTTVAAHVKPEHKQRAKNTFKQWFGF